MNQVDFKKYSLDRGSIQKCILKSKLKGKSSAAQINRGSTDRMETKSLLDYCKRGGYRIRRITLIRVNLNGLALNICINL